MIPTNQIIFLFILFAKNLLLIITLYLYFISSKIGLFSIKKQKPILGAFVFEVIFSLKLYA